MIHKLRDIALVLLPVVLLSACDSQPESVEKPEVIRPVKAMKVTDVTQMRLRWFPGRAKATREVDLAFRVAGPLITRPANVGDVVKAGDVAAQIDPRDFEVALRNVEGRLEAARAELAAMRQARPEDIRRLKAAVEKAQAANRLGEQEYKRITGIRDEDPGAVSQDMIDRATEQRDRAAAELRRAREDLKIGERGARAEDIAAKDAEIRSLEASVESASDQLGYTHLRAPFDGTIVATYVENFEDVRAKQPIVRLLDTSRIEMTIDISESLISLAPQVKDVTVVFDPFPDREIVAVIKEIGTEASETTRTYPVTLIMDQPEDITILPGMAGKATGRTVEEMAPDQTSVDIPVSATFTAGSSGQSFVWVIDEQSKTVSRREVKVGQFTDTGVRILEGLELGEWIAIAGVHYLREGQQVRLLTN
ncbi:MAG: efflux RND transporter periplasmic adaptor subunit [Kiloniellales bacterium]